MMEREQRAEQKKGTAGKVILLGLGLIGIGVGGYFAYRHFTKDKEPLFYGDDSEENKPSESSGTVPNNPVQTNTEKFPLKRGSRGKYVGVLQRTLARRFGLAVLGSGGIDQIFGKDTERALTRNGLPKVITRRLFEDFTKMRTTGNKNTVIVKGQKQGITVSNPKEIAEGLRRTVLKGRFDLALEHLAEINTAQDYDLVNTFFKEFILFGVRKTIVTALLQRFNSAADTKKLAVHFNRMGLIKKADGKWYKREGLGAVSKRPKVKAVRKAKVWNIKGESLEVPANTILGEYLHAENGVTEFATIDDKVLFIRTNYIAYA